ncbi:MAG: cytochrome P450 [Kocuria sp.]|nr:cytochrome P450 [Kocuria sp.]
MAETQQAQDWDPSDPSVRANQTTAYDRMRGKCPVAHSDALNWSLFRHEDVMRALCDPETFSSAVSRHVAVPNGMDRPEHTIFREVVDRYFTPEKMAEFEPALQALTAQLLQELTDDAAPVASGARGEAVTPGAEKSVTVEVMSELANPFALRCQSAFMGWPRELEPELERWVRRNHEATTSRDRSRTSEVALEFDGYIRQLLDDRRDSPADRDNTSRLLHETVYDRKFTEDEIVSIVRNWTVGELSTIAGAVGIVLGYLAEHQDVQRQLRENPEQIVAATDEIQRIEDPFVTNRRVTTEDVELSGRKIPAGSKITLMWSSANRDDTVFSDPDDFRLDRDPEQNLVYGAGIHVCPGAPMARLELKVLLEQIFELTERIESAGKSVRAEHPAGGFHTVPVRLVLR